MRPLFLFVFFLPPDLKLAHNRLLELQCLAPVECEVVIYDCSKYVGSRTFCPLPYSNKATLYLLLPIHTFSLLSFSSILTFLFLFLAPSQKHIILHTNLSVRLDSLNMSLRGQSMQKMEVMLLVRNSGIGNPNRNLRRRSKKKRRRSRGNNVRTIVPKY